jgi:hypothetical protein
LLSSRLTGSARIPRRPVNTAARAAFGNLAAGPRCRAVHLVSRKPVRSACDLGVDVLLKMTMVIYDHSHKRTVAAAPEESGDP